GMVGGRRVAGPAKAYELLYTGEPVDAHEAHRIGLINRLAPAGQALSAAVALAEMLASRPALALSLIRAGVRDSLNQTTQEAITRTLADSHRVFTGADMAQGTDAFWPKAARAFPAAPRAARHSTPH